MDKLKLAAIGERLKIGGERLKTSGAEMGRKVSGKMKEILQGQSQEAKMVDEATSDNLVEPNWGLNLRICALLNGEELNGPEVTRAIKKKIANKNAVSQRLSLDLLETCAMNCDKVFSEVASEKVLDEIVKMIDNPQTFASNRQRALQLLKAWGESEDLAYLPVFNQTYMSLKARNVPYNVEQNGNPAPGISSVEPEMYEPLSFPEGDLNANINNQSTDAYDATYLGGGLTIEEKREILVVTRNTVEILSSILNSEAPNEAIKDDLTLSMVEKCKDSEQVVQRIMETVGDDDEMLFEALNVHEDLQKVLSHYTEIESAVPPPKGLSMDMESSADSNKPRNGAADDAEGVEEAVSRGHGNETGDGKNADRKEPSLV
uniref:TOM1-like protein 2 n=1 Tax=Anthurium amnicola TaxID=1678845 RepID=A0A1D1Y281_9ARAE